MGRAQPECRQPLGEDVLGVSTDLRNGPQQRGKDQNSGVFAPVITQLGILRKKGRALRVVGERRPDPSGGEPFLPENSAKPGRSDAASWDRG